MNFNKRLMLLSAAMDSRVGATNPIVLDALRKIAR